MITEDTFNTLEALWKEISTAPAPSADLDAKLYAAIKEPMEVLQSRTPETGYKYTLNVTNALKLRAKSWYMSTMEIGQPNQPFAGVQFEHRPSLGWVDGGTSMTGASLGLATCSAIARVWSILVRQHLDAAG